MSVCLKDIVFLPYSWVVFYYDANILKISESTKSEVQAKPCYGLYIKESIISRPRKAVMDCIVIILAT